MYIRLYKRICTCAYIHLHKHILFCRQWITVTNTWNSYWVSSRDALRSGEINSWLFVQFSAAMMDQVADGYTACSVQTTAWSQLPEKLIPHSSLILRILKASICAFALYIFVRLIVGEGTEAGLSWRWALGFPLSCENPGLNPGRPEIHTWPTHFGTFCQPTSKVNHKHPIFDWQFHALNNSSFHLYPLDYKVWFQLCLQLLRIFLEPMSVLNTNITLDAKSFEYARESAFQIHPVTGHYNKGTQYKSSNKLKWVNVNSVHGNSPRMP